MAIRSARILRPVFQDMHEDQLQYGADPLAPEAHWPKPVSANPTDSCLEGFMT